MLLAARDAQAFVKGLDEAAFLASRLHQNAAIRSLEVLGEAAGKISVATQAAHPEIAWREITGMRHRLIHGYSEVRLDLVWVVQSKYTFAVHCFRLDFGRRRRSDSAGYRCGHGTHHMGRKLW
jgi:uncharacterized protein with HEPN domain